MDITDVLPTGAGASVLFTSERLLLAQSGMIVGVRKVLHIGPQISQDRFGRSETS